MLTSKPTWRVVRQERKSNKAAYPGQPSVPGPVSDASKRPTKKRAAFKTA